MSMSKIGQSIRKSVGREIRIEICDRNNRCMANAIDCYSSKCILSNLQFNLFLCFFSFFLNIFISIKI